MKTMKALILGGVISLASAFVLVAQTPAEPSPTATLAATPPAPTATPTVTIAIMPASTLAPTPVASPAVASAPNAFADDIKRKAHPKSKHGVHIDFGDDDTDTVSQHRDNDAIPDNVIPIVFFSLLAVFGTPVAIVAVIMILSWAKARSLHRTVREMVAKGQPVPPELLASRAGAPLRPWYDLRRGIILLAVGVGVMFFFLAVAGWDAGVWAFGLIPAIIGTGYILTWRLAQKHENRFKV